MDIFYTGASAIGTGPHLDFRVWDVADNRYINPNEFTDLLMVNNKPLVESDSLLNRNTCSFMFMLFSSMRTLHYK